MRPLRALSFLVLCDSIAVGARNQSGHSCVIFAVVLGLDKLYNVVGTTAFAVFVKLVDVMFALAMFAVIVMVVLLPCLDFRNRFFKDQGYLTHTLPVKTSTLIGARLICDLVMIAWMVAVYGLAVCVATGNFEVFSDFVGFVAFTLVFFRIRTRAGMENGGMQQELSDRQITGRLLWKYAAGYLVLWGILRIAFLISRVTGWGNINGASAVEYVRQMWNTSLLEKWAYFFAGMIMFAFVLSLFPLAVIREKVRWIRYALVDGAVFALVCLGMNGVCRLKFEQKSSGRATCLIDHLLLCGRMRTWQEITCLLAMVVFILVIGAFVFSYASRQYAVKNIDGIPASAGEEESRRHRMIRKIVTVGCSIAAAAIVVVIVLLMPKDTAGDYTKVAEFLTEDTRMGPMEYGDAVYVPVNEEADLEKNGIAQGYLAERGERCDSRFYQLAIANLLYTDPTGKTNLVQTAGTDGGTYAPVASVETDKAWETDDVFLLWDEDWALESAYSHEPTGYVACPADLIQGLRMQFPDVTYRTADFSDYDAYFTLRGYQEMEQALEEDPVDGDWVGCILVKDNKFYFGSYENQITGICLQQLRKVLGGNAK